jgi:hypothetical protein
MWTVSNRLNEYTDPEPRDDQTLLRLWQFKRLCGPQKRSDDWTHHAYPRGPEGHPWFWTITAVEFRPRSKTKVIQRRANRRWQISRRDGWRKRHRKEPQYEVLRLSVPPSSREIAAGATPGRRRIELTPKQGFRFLDPPRLFLNNNSAPRRRH